MCNNKECAEYFKRQQAYRRCFQELRKKWKSYGKVAGNIVLKETSEEERRAIGGVVGKVFYEKDIRFSFKEFERGLQQTCYAPVDMKSVLEKYFGETLSTNQREREEEQKKKNEFLQELCRYFLERAGGEMGAFLWMQEVVSAGKYGYQLLVREYMKDAAQAETFAQNVGKALVKLEKEKETEGECPLAVLAAEVSGNPHYFDRGTTPGQLLMHAISYCEKMEFPQTAHQWRELLLHVGIVPDNVSSMVHAYGLRLQRKDGYHPAYDAFCRLKEPYVITMENLSGMIGAQAVGNKVYVVENEMVFSYLLDNAKEENLTLLCTSGQPRTVALELVSLILASSVTIYYSGDIDPDGIRIADRLWQKFGDGIRIWRMSSEDYEKSLSKEEIGNIGMAKLENVKHPLLTKTAECLKEKRVAGYQENILKELLEDIKAGI